MQYADDDDAEDEIDGWTRTPTMMDAFAPMVQQEAQPVSAPEAGVVTGGPFRGLRWHMKDLAMAVADYHNDFF